MADFSDSTNRRPAIGEWHREGGDEATVEEQQVVPTTQEGGEGEEEQQQEKEVVLPYIAYDIVMFSTKQRKIAKQDLRR